MPRRYITETIQEKVPLLIVAEDGQFRRILSKNIADLYPDVEGIVIGRKRVDELGITALPQVVVWVVSSTHQFASEEGMVRELTETYQARLYVIAPKELNLGAALSKGFPRNVLIVVPALTPTEGGVNACIHEILSSSQKSGVIEVAFPMEREELAVRAARVEKEAWGADEPGDSTGIAPAGRPVRVVEPYVTESTPVIVRSESPELRVSFGGRHIEPELPMIIEPPPPLFSHLPNEHEVFTGAADSGWRSELGRRAVEIPPQPVELLGEENEERQNLISSLFSRDEKGGGRTHSTKTSLGTSKEKPTGKIAHSSVEKRRGIARKLLAAAMVFIAALFMVASAVVYAMKSFTSEFNRFQELVLSDTVDAETLGKATQSMNRQLQVVGVLNRFIQPVVRSIGLYQYGENFDQVYNVAQREVTTAQELERYAQTLAKIYSGIIDRDNVDTMGAIQEAVVGVDKATKAVQLLTAELAKDSDNAQIQNTAANSAGYKKLASMRRDLLGMQHLFSRLPSLLGQEKKQTYIVLIQNPLELRPTGGFISAYALVTFEKGKLLDVQVQDSYVADDQLKGRVDPPADLQRFLGEKQWYFRDSNWDASFPLAARQAEWFIDKELGVVADGVVGMNMYSLQALLKVTGPVQLRAYSDEIVNADNLFERVQTKSELTFSLNGEQKKKEYLTSVAEEVFTKLQELNTLQAEDFSSALLQQLAAGNLQMSVKKHDDEQVLERLGWNGEVMTPSCPQQFVGDQCFVDTVYAVDTNVGVNRANYYVKKTVNHSILLTPQAAVHTYTMRFSNGALSSAWPSGPYKNYVRLYVPDYAQVNSVVVNQKPVSPNDLLQFDERGKKVVGFYVETPIGGTSVASVNYSTILSGSKAFSYAVFTQKQPGVEPYPLSFSLHVQSPLVIKTLAPEGVITGNVIQIDSMVDKSQYMAVELGK